MQPDIRGTNLFRDLLKFCSDVRQPGKGRISDAAQVRASPDGKFVVFTATVAARIDEEPATRIAVTDLQASTTRLLTSGSSTDQLPRFSPAGRTIAFLSDRGEAKGFQLSLLELDSGAIREAATVEGSIEQFQWSEDGARILLNVVGTCSPASSTEPPPAWLPSVEPGGDDRHRRSCWIYEVAANVLSSVAAKECNTWEASWCGPRTLVVVASVDSGEGYWYSSCLRLVDIATGIHRAIYSPADQLGTPAVSPEGSSIAIVEGLSSDRGPVIGDLRLIDVLTGDCRKANTCGVDVANVEWYSERHLLLSGSRGIETVIGLYDAVSGRFSETWSSHDMSMSRLVACALETPGDCVMVTESFTQAPELAVIRGGRYRRVETFDAGYTEAMGALDGVEQVTWSSADGLEIQGLLLRPRAPAPFSLIMEVHGGPVGHWKPSFCMRRMLHIPLLLSHGFAVFLPNPRGSSGRGQEFARKVMGDLGGADALDLLAGLDALIERGIADRARIGVNGTSYGGFMAARLVTQSARFAAAVAVSPHTNQVTAELLSNVSQFMSRLVNDELGNAKGRYFERSPVLHTLGGKTPVLNLCGALDRCTPPEEAIQFHNALLKSGIESVLVTYPQEGHGIRRLPAMLDCATRIAAWFIEHIPARS